MNSTTNNLRLEMLHHDREAQNYFKRRKTDYIWEIPEALYLLKRKYFTDGQIVIDMGCGPATSIRNILGYKIINKIKYVGIDISKQMLKIAKKNVPMGLFRKGDIETIQFPNNYADVIISLGALHHSINKEKTLRNWTNIIKHGGYLLLREPTFESLKQGQGESPMEEGIKIDNLIDFLKENNYRILNVTFFSSKVFHFFNRIMIMLHLDCWKKHRLLWYPVTVIDVFLGKLLSPFSLLFKGFAFTLIAKKL